MRTGLLVVFLAAYSWPQGDDTQTLAQRIDPPANYERVAAADGSFGAWLRGLPVKKGRPVVYLHDGEKKGNQRAHHVVIDIDIGKRDLQQCADAVMRLRAEYLRDAGREKDVCFRFSSGDKHPWPQWRDGKRPRVKGNDVSFKAVAAKNATDANFRKYLDSVFIWAGTYSLSKELVTVKKPGEIQIGDVFIQGGFPGHAMLVADVAQNEKGERAFLLIQSYMPAQNMHVVNNPNDSKSSPWYSAADVGDLVTPEWTFKRSNLKRFSQEPCP